MLEGDMEWANKVAYAYINVDGPTDNLAPYICSALLCSRLFPQSIAGYAPPPGDTCFFASTAMVTSTLWLT